MDYKIVGRETILSQGDDVSILTIKFRDGSRITNDREFPNRWYQVDTGEEELTRYQIECLQKKRLAYWFGSEVRQPSRWDNGFCAICDTPYDEKPADCSAIVLEGMAWLQRQTFHQDCAIAHLDKSANGLRVVKTDNARVCEGEGYVTYHFSDDTSLQTYQDRNGSIVTRGSEAQYAAIRIQEIKKEI